MSELPGTADRDATGHAAIMRRLSLIVFVAGIATSLDVSSRR